MSKGQDSKKSSKKVPLKTMKEKRKMKRIIKGYPSTNELSNYIKSGLFRRNQIPINREPTRQIILDN